MKSNRIDKGRHPLMRIAFIIIHLVMVASAQAQLTTDVLKIATITSLRGWIEFIRDQEISAITLFAKHGDKFGLGARDEMRLLRSSTDGSGYTHYRYGQYHDGIEIEGAVFIVHEYNGRAISANGRIVSNLTMHTHAEVTSRDARETAIAGVPSQKYMWEDANMEAWIKESKNDAEATYYPTPQLVIAMLDDARDVVRGNQVLAYKVDVMSAEPLEGYSIYINATTGKEFKRQSLLSGCTNATATTMYNGVQTIVTDSVSATEFRLIDTCRGGGIRTLKYVGGITSDVVHSDKNWPVSDSMYTQTHWAGMMTYDYFYNVHGRDSYDGAGGVMRQVVGGPAISQYSSLGVYIGQPPNYSSNWQNALDVIGHEWTHGVILTSAGLKLSGTVESKWLSESFGDIFGAMVECYAEALYDTSKSCEDFFFAEDTDTSSSSIIIRDMCNPDSRGGASTYGGTNWKGSPGPDSYPRSGVQNKWFCLLSKGGSGTNTHPCNPYTYNVTGIGKNKADSIAYLNLTVYLTPTAHYGDARMGSIAAAKQLYGVNSNEVTQTIEAWNAVGVHDDHILLVCGEFDSISYPNVFQALYELRADTLCNSPDSTVIRSGANVEFKAGNRIRLGPGFRAEIGSTFRAHIVKPCPDWDVAKQGIVREDQTQMNSEATVQKPELRIAPNPLDQSAEIRYTLHLGGQTELSVVDQLGNKLTTLHSTAYQSKGTYTVIFQRAGLASGVYLCALRTSGSVVAQTIVVK